MKDIELKKVTLLGGAEVTVDFSQRQTSCKKCKKSIRFGVTKNSRYMPINEKDGGWESHFASCEFAKSFRKKSVDQKLDEMDKEREKFKKSIL